MKLEKTTTKKLDVVLPSRVCRTQKIRRLHVTESLSHLWLWDTDTGIPDTGIEYRYPRYSEFLDTARIPPKIT